MGDVVAGALLLLLGSMMGGVAVRGRRGSLPHRSMGILHGTDGVAGEVENGARGRVAVCHVRSCRCGIGRAGVLDLARPMGRDRRGRALLGRSVCRLLRISRGEPSSPTGRRITPDRATADACAVVAVIVEAQTIEGAGLSSHTTPCLSCEIVAGDRDVVGGVVLQTPPLACAPGCRLPDPRADDRCVPPSRSASRPPPPDGSSGAGIHTSPRTGGAEIRAGSGRLLLLLQRGHAPSLPRLDGASVALDGGVREIH